MTYKIPVAVLVGSLRANSFSGQVADALIARGDPRLVLSRLPIGALPLYNQDEELDAPPEHTAFREAALAASAFLLVTPEYNRGVPGGLKNALDIGSRPYGQSVFDRKPAAIVSQSPGAMGGILANHALRSTLMFLNMPTLAQPEMYLSNSAALFDGQGNPATEGFAKLLDSFMERFADWVELHAREAQRAGPVA
ncbi:NADPH-dependent FMN reductase [Sphingomonas sp. RB3P16]|uniref:NADPH-dependent FMN reductase n=1 Tax=Parasphingomonas frigoris TaxID=3096163 RepID=UPI002FCA0347